jgi:hypothetical protein
VWTVLISVGDWPRLYVAAHWDLAWVGLDTAQFFVLVAVALTAYYRRMIVVLFAVAGASLLLIDAWFDVTTARSGDFRQSLSAALIIELPSALALFWVAHRVVTRMTTAWHQAAFGSPARRRGGLKSRSGTRSFNDVRFIARPRLLGSRRDADRATS